MVSQLFAFHFHLENNDDVIFAGICTKQACSLLIFWNLTSYIYYTLNLIQIT